MCYYYRVCLVVLLYLAVTIADVYSLQLKYYQKTLLNIIINANQMWTILQ